MTTSGTNEGCDRPRNEIKSLLGGASFGFTCRLTGAASTFVLQILLARWMGAEALGIYVYAISWSTLLAVVAGLGLTGSATFRFIGKGLAENNRRAIAGFIRRGTQLVLTSSIVVTAIGLLFVLQSADAASPNFVAVIALLLVPFYTSFYWLSSIAQSMAWYPLAFLPAQVFRPVSLLLAVTLMWSFSMALTPVSVVSAQAITVVLIIAVQILLLRGALRRRFAPTEFEYETSAWMRTALPLLAMSLFIHAFWEINIVLAGLFLPSDELAILNAAFRLAFLIVWGILATNAITVPRSARLFAAGDTEGLQRTVARGTQLQFWGAILALIGFILGGRWMLSLFGTEFETGYNALIIIAVSQVIVAGFGPGSQLLNVAGHQRQCLIVYVCTAPILILLHALLTPRFGTQGAALAALGTITLQSFFANLITVRRLRITPSILSFRSAAE